MDGPRRSGAILAARDPVPRAALARLVGASCNLDALIEDIAAELRSRPYVFVFVAGGWQMRTRSHYAEAIRAANDGATRAAGAPELTPTELLTLSAIANLQPATRAEVSRMAGKEVIQGVEKRLAVIEAHPAIRLTPEQHCRAIERAGAATLREARRLLKKSNDAGSCGSRARALAGLLLFPLIAAPPSRASVRDVWPRPSPSA